MVAVKDLNVTLVLTVIEYFWKPFPRVVQKKLIGHKNVVTKSVPETFIS